MGEKQLFVRDYMTRHTHISKARDKIGMENDMGNKSSRSCGDVATIFKQAARCFNIIRYSNQFMKLSSRLIQSTLRSI